MRYRVDRAMCSGHGLCAAVAPDVYSLDDDGFNIAIGQTVDVASGRESAVQDGALACPDAAIVIE
jgi:ferredoxin